MTVAGEQSSGAKRATCLLSGVTLERPMCRVATSWLLPQTEHSWSEFPAGLICRKLGLDRKAQGSRTADGHVGGKVASPDASTRSVRGRLGDLENSRLV